MKHIIIAAGIAFLLNLAWEFAHAPLYLHYQGGAISSLILVRAAVVDAIIIFALLLGIHFLPKAHRQWVLIVAAIVVAIVLERWALQTGRWAYAPAMPIVPFLGTGLTPTIQLGVLGYLTYRLAFTNFYKKGIV